MGHVSSKIFRGPLILNPVTELGTFMLAGAFETDQAEACPKGSRLRGNATACTPGSQYWNDRREEPKDLDCQKMGLKGVDI